MYLGLHLSIVIRGNITMIYAEINHMINESSSSEISAFKPAPRQVTYVIAPLQGKFKDFTTDLNCFLKTTENQK